MTAVDTNVLIRVVTRDDKAEAARAVAFLQAQERMFLAKKAVLLEVEWVLRSTYKFARRDVLSALRVMVSIRNAEVEDAALSRKPLIGTNREWALLTACTLLQQAASISSPASMRRCSAGRQALEWPKLYLSNLSETECQLLSC